MTNSTTSPALELPLISVDRRAGLCAPSCSASLNLSNTTMNSLIPDNDRGHLAQAAIEIYSHACDVNTPSNLYRPRLSIDGNQWCALYGENLQDGVAGFGASPALAYADFDKTWRTPLPNVGLARPIESELGDSKKRTEEALKRVDYLIALMGEKRACESLPRSASAMFDNLIRVANDVKLSLLNRPD